MSDFSVYCLSNASVSEYNNTLTSFTNKLPLKLKFNKADNWSCALEKVGIHYNLNVLDFPVNKDVFHLIFVPNIKKKLADLRDDGKTFNFPDIPYNFDIFAAQLSAINNKFSSQIHLEINDKIRISSSLFNLNQSMKYVLIHEKIMGVFGFTPNDLNRLNEEHYTYFSFITDQFTPLLDDIDTETYYQYFKVRGLRVEVSMWDNFSSFGNETFWLIPLIGLKQFILEYPTGNVTLATLLENIQKDFDKQRFHPIKSVFIECQQIETQAFNNIQQKTLGFLQFDEMQNSRTKYVFHEYKNREYVPLQQTIISELKFKLTDENNKQINLLPGHPTLLKLHFKKMDYHTKILKVSSKVTPDFPNNKNNCFQVNFGKSLNIADRKWEVALSSISIKTEFNTFTGRLHFTIYYKEANELKSLSLEIDKKSFETPYELISKLNVHFGASGQLFFSIKDHTIRVRTPGEIKISASKELLYYMGFTKQKLIDNTSETMTFSFKKKYIFSEFVREDYLLPNYMMVYTNIIQPTIIGDDFSKIFKILPVTMSKRHELFEFEHLDYFKLQNSYVSNMKIEIRDHTGALINFAHDEEVVLSIIFKQVK